MQKEIKSETSPLEQAEAYVTECVLMANETEDIAERARKFEKAKQTTVVFLNFQIDVLQTLERAIVKVQVTNFKNGFFVSRQCIHNFDSVECLSCNFFTEHNTCNDVER